MIYLTAAYGDEYVGFLRGFLRSWCRSMSEYSLRVEVGPLKHAEEMARSYGKTYGADRQGTNVFKFALMREILDEHPQETVCWIDCDELVTADLSRHVHDRAITVLQHPAHHPEKVSIGNGLRGTREDLCMGGMFTMTREVLDLVEAAVREMPKWERQGQVKGSRDQTALGYVIKEHGIPSVRLTDDKRYVYNFADFTTKGWHPKPGNKALSEIEWTGDGFDWWGREIVLWSWVTLTLREFIAEDFATFKPEVRKRLKEFYA